MRASLTTPTDIDRDRIEGCIVERVSGASSSFGFVKVDKIVNNDQREIFLVVGKVR